MTITKRGAGLSLNGSAKELKKLLSFAVKAYEAKATDSTDEDATDFYTEQAAVYSDLSSEADTVSSAK